MALNGQSSAVPTYFAELFQRSEAESIGLSFEQFSEALLTIGSRFLTGEAKKFYSGLHLKELALAQACSRGSAVAWARFLDCYRNKLYSAALVIAKDECAARELSDSLFGDLFGGAKFASYSGRGSLEGWLKAVLTHAYVDRYRSERRLVRLDERLPEVGAACLLLPTGVDSLDTARLQRAIELACVARTEEERYLLAAYFCDERSLAEIGRTIGAHESTVSRRLKTVLRDLRIEIGKALGLSRRQIGETLETHSWSLPFDIRGILTRGIDITGD